MIILSVYPAEVHFRMPVVQKTMPPGTAALRDLVRRRALDRLYERRAAVESLIRAIEGYQSTERRGKTTCIPRALAGRQSQVLR